MKLVVDSNIIFSALLNPRSNIGQIIINGSKYFSFISVNQLKDEISHHQEKILKISGLNVLEFERLFGLIKKKIKFIHHILIDDANYKKAEILTNSIDPDDVLFVGLAIQLRCKLWSGDKKLIKGLLNKGFKQTIYTDELFQIYLDKEFEKKRKKK